MSQKLSDIIDSTQPTMGGLTAWMYQHPIIGASLIAIGLAIFCFSYSYCYVRSKFTESRNIRRNLLLIGPVGAGVLVALLINWTMAYNGVIRDQQDALITHSAQTYNIELPLEVAEAMVSQSEQVKERDYSFTPTKSEAERLSTTMLTYRVLTDGSLVLLNDDDQIIEPN